MDANIKTPQDALEWLDRSIREEAELDGEMSNAHAIQLGFIQNMLAKFPRRNCDRFASAEEADAAYRRFCEREVAKIPLDAVDYSKERAKIPTKDKWLFAPATEKEGEIDGGK